MAKRSADVSEFGFVRLSAWQAYEADSQGVNSRCNSMPQQTGSQPAVPKDCTLDLAASRPPSSEQLDAHANTSAGASPVPAVQQGYIVASGAGSPSTTSPSIRHTASMGALPSAATECQGAESSTSAGWSPGSVKKRSWKQWGKQKLWRGSSASSPDAHPATLGMLFITLSRVLEVFRIILSC